MARFSKAVGRAVLAFALAAPAAARTAQDTFVYVHVSEVTSLDPVFPYDAISQSVIYNLYETLIAFKGSSLTEFEPRLAVEVPTRRNGGISQDGRTYRFRIRKGVRFHSGSEMTPEDVRYSLLRFMLSDRAGGPSSLLLEPILGRSSTRGPGGRLEDVYGEASRAVRVEGDDVVVRLPRPFAPFLSIMARWSYVVPRKAAAGWGGWDGKADDWKLRNDPKIDATAFFDRADGTGPFRLARWDRQARLILLERSGRYWRKPAALRRVVYRSVPEFSTRRLLLQGGDADLADVPAPFASQIETMDHVALRAFARLRTDPVLFFTLEVNPRGNPDIGSGRLDGEGIPPDFFKDPDVRKGFAYAFDYRAYLRDTFKGRATRASGPIPASLLKGRMPKGLRYDLKKARAHLEKAWGGEAWKKGFAFTLTYNTGSEVRETACQILKKNVESLNPKFRIRLRPVDWPVFLDKTQKRLMPMWARGWIADYPDAHNFAFPFLHSQGRYPIAQAVSDPDLDRLVEAAVRETDPKKRFALYRKLTKLANDRVYQIYTVHPTELMAVSDRVGGYIDNPVFMGPWFYPVRKTP